MARILFIAANLNDSILSHAETIKSAGHQITILTSKSENSKAPANIQTLCFFKTWSSWEWFRFLPSLFYIKPQLFHFVIDSNQKLSAQWLFIDLAKQLKIPISSHFLNLTYVHSKNKNLIHFTFKSDLITCAHRQTLIDLRGFESQNKKQIRGVIPPQLKFSVIKYQSLPSSNCPLKFFPEKRFYMPFNKDFINENSLERKIAKKLIYHRPTVFLGNLNTFTNAQRKHIDHTLKSHIGSSKTWTYFHSEQIQDSLNLITKNDLLFLAGLDLNIEELSKIFEVSLLLQIKIIIDEFQAQLFSGLWQNRKNCIILNQNFLLKDLTQLIEDDHMDFISPFSENKNQKLKSEITDAPINEFNRLLNKVLNLRHEEKY